MDAAGEHVVLQPGLVLAAIGAVSPDIASSVAYVDHAAQLTLVVVGRRGDIGLVDEPKAPVDRGIGPELSVHVVKPICLQTSCKNDGLCEMCGSANQTGRPPFCIRECCSDRC